ncbi:unnamed protein product [Amoebophrya sp. A120]|nr:unnamed protein product [Amoebophrya sp. A120]|eukprot:GSA120T00021266001.1
MMRRWTPTRAFFFHSLLVLLLQTAEVVVAANGRRKSGTKGGAPIKSSTSASKGGRSSTLSSSHHKGKNEAESRTSTAARRVQDEHQQEPQDNLQVVSDENQSIEVEQGIDPSFYIPRLGFCANLEDIQSNVSQYNSTAAGSGTTSSTASQTKTIFLQPFFSADYVNRHVKHNVVDTATNNAADFDYKQVFDTASAVTALGGSLSMGSMASPALQFSGTFNFSESKSKAVQTTTHFLKWKHVKGQKQFQPRKWTREDTIFANVVSSTRTSRPVQAADHTAPPLHHTTCTHYVSSIQYGSSATGMVQVKVESANSSGSIGGKLQVNLLGGLVHAEGSLSGSQEKSELKTTYLAKFSTKGPRSTRAAVFLDAQEKTDAFLQDLKDTAEGVNLPGKLANRATEDAPAQQTPGVVLGYTLSPLLAAYDHEAAQRDARNKAVEFPQFLTATKQNLRAKVERDLHNLQLLETYLDDEIVPRNRKASGFALTSTSLKEQMQVKFEVQMHVEDLKLAISEVRGLLLGKIVRNLRSTEAESKQNLQGLDVFQAYEKLRLEKNLNAFQPGVENWTQIKCGDKVAEPAQNNASKGDDHGAAAQLSGYYAHDSAQKLGKLLQRQQTYFASHSDLATGVNTKLTELLLGKEKEENDTSKSLQRTGLYVNFTKSAMYASQWQQQRTDKGDTKCNPHCWLFCDKCKFRDYHAVQVPNPNDVNVLLFSAQQRILSNLEDLYYNKLTKGIQQSGLAKVNVDKVLGNKDGKDTAKDGRDDDDENKDSSSDKAEPLKMTEFTSLVKNLVDLSRADYQNQGYASPDPSHPTNALPDPLTSPPGTKYVNGILDPRNFALRINAVAREIWQTLMVSGYRAKIYSASSSTAVG